MGWVLLLPRLHSPAADALQCLAVGSRAVAVVLVHDHFQKYTREILLANTHQRNSLNNHSTCEAGPGLWRPPEPGSGSKQSQLAG